MPCRKPVSREATVTTVVIPITIPRIVSNERNRCAQTCRIARLMFSVGLMFIGSLCSERHDGVEAGGARRRVPARGDPHDARNSDRKDHVSQGDVQLEAEYLPYYERQQSPR